MFRYIRWRKAKTATLTLTLTFYSRGEEKEGKYSEMENIFFWRKRKPEKEKGGNIWKRYLKDIEKSQFRFQSRDFCQFLEGFGISFGEFGLGKKVSVLVLENLVSEKKVSVSLLENLVSEKKSRYRFRSKF